MRIIGRVPGIESIAFWALRPRLLARRLRGLSVSEVSLEEIDNYLPPDPVIVEAGACDGGDTARMSARWPLGVVHAFEPVPESFARLAERTAGLPGVRRYQEALSDHDGEATIHISEDIDGTSRPDSSSLLRPSGHLEAWPTIAFPRSVTVATVRLNTWIDRESVDRIDLLWLDLQGMELRVLAEATEALARTRAIYVEVWREGLYDGSASYRALVRFLRQRGFRPVIRRVPRVFGNVLFVRPYH